MVGESNIIVLFALCKRRDYNVCLTLEWYRVLYFELFEIVSYKELNNSRVIVDVLLVIPLFVVARASRTGGDIPGPPGTTSPKVCCRTEIMGAAVL